MSRGVMFPFSLLFGKRGLLFLVVLAFLYIVTQLPSSNHVLTDHYQKEQGKASTAGSGSSAARGRDSSQYANTQISEDMAKMRQWHQEEEQERWGWGWVKDAAAKGLKDQLDWVNGKSGKAAGSSSNSKPSVKKTGNGDSDLLAYRQHLETEHSPHGYTKHSPTLTFSSIYVLSLPKRTDRRLRMSKIAKALGLKFTFVDATHKESPLIGWIAERVKEVRDRKRPILSQYLKVEEKLVGGSGVDSPWLSGNDTSRDLSFPDLAQLDDRWRVRTSSAELPRPTLSSEELADQEGDDERPLGPLDGRQTVNWLRYLDTTSDLDQLAPMKSAHFTTLDAYVADILYDPVESSPARQVNAGVLATYYSQTRVWKKMLQNKDESALILEDDVDFEWDIERQWANIARVLPDDWEVVFLGHCWGKELAKAQYLHPQLHKSTEPRCLHAYALSNRGARHLLKLISDPWRAYQTPVDTFIPYLTRQSTAAAEKQLREHKKGASRLTDSPSRIEDIEDPEGIQAFSLEPPLIIQSKNMISDIQSGTGSVWRGLLADSTWDRVLRDEGKTVKQLTWNDIKGDPAIRARPWGDWKGANKYFQEEEEYRAAEVKQAEEKSLAKVDESKDLSKSRVQPPFAQTKEDAPKAKAEPINEAQALAREKAMARPVDDKSAEERERERILENLPKKPGPLLAKKPPNLKAEDTKEIAMDPGSKKIQDKNREAMNAVAEALKKGEKAPKKGGEAAVNRVGTGPMLVGRPPDERARR